MLPFTAARAAAVPPDFGISFLRERSFQRAPDAAEFTAAEPGMQPQHPG